MNYQKKLESNSVSYPFDKWRSYVNEGLEQYTPENCNKAKSIFDELISNLVRLGENASEQDKVAMFEKAVVALNVLNDELDGDLIETGEREELCELIDLISVSANLESSNYGEGEGLASEWREW